ncbi:uracil-DNA glycosylase family protein [Yeosuana sp. MJ-SS3]|uniref:Uracil-DNA glycosylase family protein n=1 Tax=Gilvirhabdus luticola TaxID=3079858 RepID=A0ABU3U4J2_9FLAO|nr:uracil-DNA glycosylase family protein [Yeosuana sp. MJ-SS3]MDU8885335.1 uracil-DNA glycosylase family protein [Yeosuana sp. MJ-SS3]
MFLHRHPYQPFIQDNTRKLIVGTLPPPRFSVGDLLEKDVDFCYGSYYNSLWLYIDKIHGLNLRYDNSQEAIEQRKQFLLENRIGICDIVESCKREKIDASDLGMQNIVLRNLVGYVKKYPNVQTLLFIGGNSKNGPEYFFRKHLKEYDLELEVVSHEVPRIHEFILNNRTIKTVSLTSSSGSANRAIGSMPLYKQLKINDPDFTTFDFRVMQYSEFF